MTYAMWNGYFRSYFMECECSLRMEIWAWDQNPKNEDAQSDYVVVSRSFILPFAPTKGMKIQLGGIMSDSPHVKKYRKARKATKVSISPIFEIEEIFFIISVDGAVSKIELTSSLKCDWGEYVTVADRDAVVDQLVYGYGFEKFKPHRD